MVFSPLIKKGHKVSGRRLITVTIETASAV